MMKYKLIIIFFILILFGCGQFVKSGNKHFLWRAENGESIVYLLGSIHIGTAGLYPLPEIIETSFEESDYVVVEANILENQLIDSFTMLIKYGSYPIGNNLEKDLSPKMYTNILDVFSDYEINEFMLKRMKPWVISLLIEQLTYDSFGYEAIYGIDYHFLAKAKNAGKPVIELESVEEQMMMMNSMSAEAQLFLLESALSPQEETEDDYRDLFEAWNTGDTSAVEKMFENDTEGCEEFNNILIVERNKAMTDKVEAFLSESGVYFVIVGAGHLLGETGIIESLESRGYQFQQL